MTALKSHRPPVSRKSMAGQALFVVVMLLIMRFLWVRNQPERLTTPPISEAWKISGDYRYALAYRDPDTVSEPSIQAQPLHDLAVRTLAAEDNRYSFYLRDWQDRFSVGRFSIANGKLYYAMEPRPLKSIALEARPMQRTDSGGGAVVVMRSLGTFRAEAKSPPDTGARGKKSAASTATSLSTPQVRLRQLAIQGGTPQDVASLPGKELCFIGDHVFWIRPSPDNTSERIVGQGPQKGTYWNEEICHSDLMLTSLKDGTNRCLHSGLSSRSYLIAGQSGVSWDEPAAFPDKPTIFYARVSVGSVRSLGGLTENGFNFDGRSLVEFGNRLYWLALLSTRRSDQHRKLMSANLDGADMREISAQKDQSPLDCLMLHVYRGSLYGCFAETFKRADGAVVRHDYLCRIHPERSDPIQIVYKLPEKSFVRAFDSGYLYFDRPESKGSLWATLTADGAAMDTTTSFYRIPLN